MDSGNLTTVVSIEAVDLMSEQKLKSILEAILFAASEPISIEQFQDALPEIGKRAIRKALTALQDEYREIDRSFHLVEIANGYQVCTRPEYSEWIQKFLYPTSARYAVPIRAGDACKSWHTNSLSHVPMSQQFAVSIAIASSIRSWRKD